MSKIKIFLLVLLLTYLYADKSPNMICTELCESRSNYSCMHNFLIPLDSICSEQNITKSMNYLTLLANKDNHHAEFALGEIYLYGIGIPRNFIKAFEMHERAYSHGNTGSPVALGKMLILGQGRKQDCKKGIELLNSRQDDPVSSQILGLIYFSPLCGDINLTKAEEYLKYASEHSIPEAQFYFALLLGKKDSERNKDKVLELITLSAENGYIKAQLSLGYYYLLEDENKAQDFKKAKSWIKKAKDQNSTKAIELWNEYKLWEY